MRVRGRRRNTGAFYGEGIAPDGRKEAIVGVVRFGDESLLLSGDSGTMQGRFIGNKLELCWVDSLPEWNGVACSLHEKKS